MKGILILIFLVGSVLRLSAQEQPLAVGKVIDTIRSKANRQQSYSLYLPKNYSRSKTWPVIFFYDPGARGSFPVNLYRTLAEKYQCILVGSNNSRNGPINVTQESEQAILRDVESRLSIDKSRLFVSGFSGGARASVFLSMQRKIYAGIIACGAAFPTTAQLTTKDSTPFIEVIGNTDMNFTEAIEAEKYLAGINYPHALLIFQGTHTWPPAAVYDQAIFWQLYRSKPPTKSLAASYDSSIVSKAEEEMKSGDLVLANWNLKNTVSFSPKIDSLKKRISSDPLFVKQQKSFLKVLQNEKEFLQEFYALYDKINYVRHDSAFKETEWRNLITRVNKLSKSDDMLYRQMHERLVQQIKIGCIGGYQGEMELKRYLQASLKARIVTMLEPDYKSYVLLARAYAKLDRRSAAIQALSKAADLGLSDRLLLKSNDFAMLANEKKFNAVVQQVELNAKKSP